jgi:hypothetical protein
MPRRMSESRSDAEQRHVEELNALLIEVRS